jgi:A/G-specific adenine glycosylase
MDFSERILSWYQKNKRELPWRNTRDPYRIWLSEIIMQQTRVAQGLPYYLRFTERFPRIEDLAAASEEEVLKTWQGLGYYSRARNLHATARYVALENGGRFPSSYEGLLALKGVGPYTAAAIGSICYDLPRPVVDGNVYRVLGRYFGVELPINRGDGTRYFSALAEELLDRANPGTYNQALMEFGALQCVPQTPDCVSCPLSDSCAALATQKVSSLPVKLPKKEVRKRYFNYYMPVDPGSRTLLLRRDKRGIWEGLYEFPLIESESEQAGHRVGEELVSERYPELGQVKESVLVNPLPVVHKLSHQHLYVTFHILHLEEVLREGIPLSEMQAYPVPVLIANFMETVKNSYF